MTIALDALRDQPFALLQAMERRLRAVREDLAAPDAALWTGLSLRLRDEWLVVPRDDVAEVAPLPPLTRVPGARPFLLGVANLHGTLLPVTDLGRLLGREPAARHREQRVLVLNSRRIAAGFLVDEIGGYRTFSPGDQRHALCKDSGALEPWLLGAFVNAARPWPVLSLHKLALGEQFNHAGA